MSGKYLASAFTFLFLFVSVLSAQVPKYVFLFLGDGMGQEIVSLGRQAAAFRNQPWYVQGLDEKGNTVLSPELCASGFAKTASLTPGVTDSAASATAIACGYKTENGRLGVDQNYSILKSLGFMAKENGAKVGIITSEGINHASPAAFYAHVASRFHYPQIALEMHLSGFDYFGGENIISAGRNPQSQLETAVAEQALKTHGYTILRGDSDRISYKGTGKLFVSSPVNYALTRTETDNSVSLAHQLEKAVSVFEQSGSFFIFAEGAKIDHNAEGCDTAGVLAELDEFNDAIRAAFDFAKKHPQETLIVITADHNSGGMKFLSQDGTITKEHYDLLLKQKKNSDIIVQEFRQFASGENAADKRKDMETLKTYMADALGLPLAVLTGDDLAKLKKIYEASVFREKDFAKVFFLRRDALTGIRWTGPGHFPDDVNVFAFGVGAKKFCGTYENYEICRKIANLAYPDQSPFPKQQPPAADPPVSGKN